MASLNRSIKRRVFDRCEKETLGKFERNRQEHFEFSVFHAVRLIEAFRHTIALSSYFNHTGSVSLARTARVSQVTS